MNVQIKTQWSEFSTGRKFDKFLVEIIFCSGAVDTAEPKELYIDDKKVEPDFDALYLEVRRVEVYEITEVVKIYT
ncbi:MULTISPECIES: hypothetical protein [Thermoprotei]|uniref:hypothetical protein n=1 Tax=Thermoprotei TaxID=183924 RepID=UPI0031638B20